MMQSIIMTVGTSLRTNKDGNLPPEQKRPWVEKKASNEERMIDNVEEALAWMDETPWELISAETNTFWRLDPSPDDEITLLHSDTVSGLECGEILQRFFGSSLGQKKVNLVKIPGINYDVNDSTSALEKMANLLVKLIEEARGNVTLAATGGFKAETIIMGIIGNSQGVPVCYIHEEFQGLIYLPYLFAEPQIQSQKANLPESSIPRNSVLKVRSDQEEPNRPRSWQKVKEKILLSIPWIERVYYEERAYSAPKNGVKLAHETNTDGCYVIWLHLHDKKKKMAVAVDTTAHTLEQAQEGLKEIRERLGRLL